MGRIGVVFPENRFRGIRDCRTLRAANQFLDSLQTNPYKDCETHRRKRRCGECRGLEHCKHSNQYNPVSVFVFLLSGSAQLPQPEDVKLFQEQLRDQENWEISYSAASITLERYWNKIPQTYIDHIRNLR